MSDAPPTSNPAIRIARGIFMLARFRPAGLQAFTATPQGFLNSLAPLVAFPLVGFVLMLLAGRGVPSLRDPLVTLVALLSPAVASHALARRWGREAAWLRYAVAFNWCQWALPIAAAPVLLATGMLAAAGLPTSAAALLTLLLLAGYGLALHWFLARYGLGLSRGRAVLFVVLVNAATMLLVIAPQLLAGDALPTGSLDPT